LSKDGVVSTLHPKPSSPLADAQLAFPWEWSGKECVENVCRMSRGQYKIFRGRVEICAGGKRSAWAGWTADRAGSGNLNGPGWVG